MKGQTAPVPKGRRACPRWSNRDNQSWGELLPDCEFSRHMFFKQFYLGCLAHASYLIGSDGEAAVADPQRDVDQYIEEARAQNLKIKYIIETHLHADFISGHRELTARSGAQIVFGERAGAAFAHRAVKEGDHLNI